MKHPEKADYEPPVQAISSTISPGCDIVPGGNRKCVGVLAGSVSRVGTLELVTEFYKTLEVSLSP